MCGISILALTAVHGNRQGYILFVWIYGIFCGGYHYSLKMYTYERVRARNFARTWGFVQCSQAIPIAIGVPISGKNTIKKNTLTNWLLLVLLIQSVQNNPQLLNGSEFINALRHMSLG